MRGVGFGGFVRECLLCVVCCWWWRRVGGETFNVQRRTFNFQRGGRGGWGWSQDGLLDADVFFAMALQAALLVTLTPAVGHFFVPVGAEDLGVGRGGGWGDGRVGGWGVGVGIGFIVGVGLGLAIETLDLGLHFFGGPGGFGAAAMFGVGGILLLDVLELAEES